MNIKDIIHPDLSSYNYSIISIICYFTLNRIINFYYFMQVS